MADETPRLRGFVKDGELYIDEDALLDEDSAQALRDLESALADEAEVVGYNFSADQVVVDLPGTEITIAMTPIPIDPGPMDIMVMGPMIMLGMMDAL